MKFSAALILKSESFTLAMYGETVFAAFGASRSNNAAPTAKPITKTTAITMIKRLESRSSATGVGCPKLPMRGIVGCCFLIVDFIADSGSLQTGGSGRGKNEAKTGKRFAKKY